jgi:hypothetical protein
MSLPPFPVRDAPAHDESRRPHPSAFQLPCSFAPAPRPPSGDGWQRKGYGSWTIIPFFTALASPPVTVQIESFSLT